MPTAAVIHNPVAGRGQGSRLVTRARETLARAGYALLDSRPTSRDGGARPPAAELADDVDLLVVIGGDGSLREALAGLGPAAARVTVGLLPLGNANVVAREVGIPLQADGALALLADGAPRLLDVGLLDGEPFVAMVGVGWDAHCVHLLARARGTRLGAALYRTWADGLYGLAGTAALLRPFPPPITVTLDDAPLPEPCYALIASNCRVYGKGWQMTPDADPADGLLDYQACRRWAPPWTTWQLLAATRRRKSPRFIARYGRARRMTLTAERPLPVQVDGDWYGYRRQLELELRPGGLRLLAPRV